MKKIISHKIFQRFFIISSSLIIALILLLSPVYFYIDSLIYDFMMVNIKKPITQDESLMLIDIDDNALEKLPYKWPWPRYIYGDALEVIAEFGAKAVVYDIEFIGYSERSVIFDNVDSIKQDIANNFEEIKSSYKTTTDLIAKNALYRSDLTNLWFEYSNKLDNLKNSINYKIDNMFIDNDKYFAKRLAYFGEAYGTIGMASGVKNIEETSKNPKDDKKIQTLLEKFAIKKESILKNKKNHVSIKKTDTILLPIPEILEKYKAIGFTNVERDKDYSLRRIHILKEYNNYIFPQLSIAPFLKINNIKPEQFNFNNPYFITIKDVHINNKIKTIRIPVDRKGYMRINWPDGKFEDIFPGNNIWAKKNLEAPQHFSIWTLLNYKYILLENFFYNLYNYLDIAGFDNANTGEKQDLLNAIDMHLKILDFKNNIFIEESNTLTDEMRVNIRKNQDDLINKALLYFTNENYDKLKKSIEETEFSRPGITEEEINTINYALKQIKIIFDENRNSCKKLQQGIEYLKQLENKICFIGFTATSTTDLGETPFDKEFENVGLHPSIYNTILQNQYIYSIPEPIILIISVIIFSFILWLIIDKKASFIALTGSGSILLNLLFIGIIYRLTNVYISPVLPFIYGAALFSIMILLKYILTEKEKSYIRNAFNKYLSPEYINEIIKDRKKLELGGIRAKCTAIFTDIQGFSSISEKFMDDPKGLVNLLKDYLSTMSDIILDNKGTIDKYEGDAIIAFFGEPLKVDDHAFRACLSSLQMKNVEKDLNKKILKSGIVNKQLLTRIGINTGDMFVGNMGTRDKFNYTIMGHAVNLAARLEGVNKLYGTYILISEYTYNEIKDKIICLKLDRVKVVNIETPVRLYEPLCLHEELKPEIKEGINIFHKALDIYEKKDWKNAEKLFKEINPIVDFDIPVNLYIERCEKYIITPPPDDWDGVYALTKK